ncbi:phosphonopyruvate decarboxylase [Achromobacter denitrificans]|uniref:thiamine pyrophosphate-binding protein n=1 Tax=Achromobacter denitrificans TaxID=32002 RepID=UPI00240E8FDB|nr:thiamine pyrophosphate-binding protein [Achromobacter denitrificans]MBV2161118.1 phosphonopyruvate decarboxylase [Achromobacter denitrificans]MDX3881622.1 thiamine pyrophosphate-binding protein [Achromobacter sp.]WFC64951.1 phosphonopyruvate decarboxylase [Achromobacter denitrificans]
MAESWPELVYRNLKEAGITQMAYVPDAGHSQLIKLFEADPEVEAISLTTEEEGVAMLGGAWLGGAKGVLLMQSSGVGNCINMLALIQECRMPFLCLVTMRGEWGEFNPWQCPMGQSAEAALQGAGVYVQRVERGEDVPETVRAASLLAFNSNRAVAVVISQRVLGIKNFSK